MNKTIDQSKINQALDLLLEGGADLSKALKKGGLIKQLSKAILERALSAEMEEHLGYSRYSRSEADNARNGSYSKNLITDNGLTELTIPRDREGSFEPIIVPKKQNRIEGLDQKYYPFMLKG
jgi:transposase-like protein